MKLPLVSIIIGSRIRDGSDPEVVELAESFKRYGQLQPVLIDSANNLLAGGRRCAAAALLGWTYIEATTRETLSPAESAEIEFEENNQRRQWTWQEMVACTVKIHNARTREAAKASKEWTQAMTAEALGLSAGYVSQALTLHRSLDDPAYKDCTSLTEAAKIRLQQLEIAAMAEQARRFKAQVAAAPSVAPSTNDFMSTLDSVPDVSDPQPPKVNEPQLAVTRQKGNVDITHTLFLGDCRVVLPTFAAESVDHIITDPPYGIDMDNLAQRANTTAVNFIKASHEVDDNLTLFDTMFKEFFRVIKPQGFCVLWCDIMNWDRLYWAAITAGFKVQRWPFVWAKTTTCANEVAQYNFTKDFEIAMICRKENTVLVKPQTSSVILWPNDTDRTLNPFSKPEQVWLTLFKAICTPGQTILDPFCGGGSCLFAALNFGLRVKGVELLEAQYNSLLLNFKSYCQTRWPNTDITYI